MRRLLLAAALLAGVAAAPAGAKARCKEDTVRNLVLVAADTGAIDSSFPDTDDGGITAVLADGRGGWFVAGGFVCVGKVVAPAVAHLNADGTLDRSFVPDLPRDRRYASGYATPISLARAGGLLYVGGLRSFGVVALDARTGKRRWRVTVDGLGGVFALAAGPHALYAGGDFDRPRKSLLRLDPRTGRLLPWRLPVFGGYDGNTPATPVEALALWHDRLFVGGVFTSVDGAARRSIAALGAATGRLLPWRVGDMSNTAGVGDVSRIVVSRGVVFTAGYDGFGISSATTGRIVPWIAATYGSSFAAHGSLVYLAGDCRNSFTGIDGQPRNNLAALHLPGGRLTSWAPQIARYTCVSALAADASRVLVAGGFTASLG